MTRLGLAFAFLLVASFPAFAQPDRPSRDWSRQGRHDGVHLRILRSYHLAEGTTVHDPIVVIGGSATIDGRAEDDVVVIGGTLRVGPTAEVIGDLVAVGGEAHIDPAARITGRVEQTSIMGPHIDFGWGWGPSQLSGRFWAAAALGATAVRLGFTLLVALLLVLVAPAWLRGLSRQATSVGSSVVAGVATQILALPVTLSIVFALVISVVGIPLLAALPFVMAAAAVAWTAGFTMVASRVGTRLRRASPDGPERPVLDLCAGFAAITAATVAAHLLAFWPGLLAPAISLGVVGMCVEYAAWTVGLGAVVLDLWGRRPQDAPPPIPIGQTPAPISF